MSEGLQVLTACVPLFILFCGVGILVDSVRTHLRECQRKRDAAVLEKAALNSARIKNEHATCMQLILAPETTRDTMMRLPGLTELRPMWLLAGKCRGIVCNSRYENEIPYDNEFTLRVPAEYADDAVALLAACRARFYRPRTI